MNISVKWMIAGWQTHFLALSAFALFALGYVSPSVSQTPGTNDPAARLEQLLNKLDKIEKQPAAPKSNDSTAAPTTSQKETMPASSETTQKPSTRTTEAPEPHPAAGNWKGNGIKNGKPDNEFEFQVAVDGGITGTFPGKRDWIAFSGTFKGNNLVMEVYFTEAYKQLLFEEELGLPRDAGLDTRILGDTSFVGHLDGDTISGKVTVLSSMGGGGFECLIHLSKDHPRYKEYLELARKKLGMKFRGPESCEEKGGHLPWVAKRISAGTPVEGASKSISHR